MNVRALPLFALGLPIALAACVAPIDAQDEHPAATEQEINLRLPVCKRPYDFLFTPAASDAIALGTLLEGAGYGAEKNSDWKDVASGNFCGGAEKELVVLKNQHSAFSILRGPVPYAINAFDYELADDAPWQSVAASDLDGDGFDEIVAVRKVTSSGKADLLLIQPNRVDCGVAGLWSTNVGGANVDWRDLAIGRFDDTGKQIALLRDHDVMLVRSNGASLTDARVVPLYPTPSLGYKWKQIAAGDLDVPVKGQPTYDELAVAREVGDTKTNTVVGYRLMRGAFHSFAESSFGNGGNSNWTGMTIGDFNGDGQGAIALQKNEHSNFAILGYQSGMLVPLDTSDLDTDPGVEWRGLTAVDWAGGDLGATELVAIRKAAPVQVSIGVWSDYRTDIFVYGNPFHRLARDSGILGQKAEWDQLRDQSTGVLNPIKDDIDSATGAHVTTISWALTTPRDYLDADGSPARSRGDYSALVELLEATKSTCVDGQRLRVSVTIPPKWACGLAVPEDSPLTSWNEFDDFSAKPIPTPRDGEVERCRDTLGWGRTFGRLAQQYPHLVSFGIDDMINTFDHEGDDDWMEDNHVTSAELYTLEELAEFQSLARQRAPWLTFVPVGYYGSIQAAPKDFAKTMDTFMYYFRNDKHGPTCIGEPCATQSLAYVNEELDDAATFLPLGRKLQVGTYWAFLTEQKVLQEAQNIYDYKLVTQYVRVHPAVGGVTAYSMIAKNTACNEWNWFALDYCTLEHAYRP